MLMKSQNLAQWTRNFLGLFLGTIIFAGSAAAQDPLRIIAFGGHPDDCEVRAAGVAAMWAAMGHKVKFVSVTNGDIGHYAMAGGPLALTRKAEIEECGRILGIEESVMLDNHDGELMPTLENRKTVARLIREWQADIVLGPRSNDYHPGPSVHGNTCSGCCFHGYGAILYAYRSSCRKESCFPVLP